jgi:hypothetical protein
LTAPAATGRSLIDDRSFPRAAALAAVISLPLAAGNLIAMLATVHFNLNGMTDPLILLHAGKSAGTLWRWSMILDILGYYLAIVPLILLLRRSLRDRSPNWVDLFALCLVAYCFIGAIGGAELATAVPTLIRQYASVTPLHRLSLQAVFTGYSDGVYRGLWNLLEELLAGIGWIGLGLVLWPDRRHVGLASLVLGAACLVDAVGTAINLDALSSTGLTVYLVLAPVWACSIGVGLLRSRRPGPALVRTAAALQP